MPDASSPLPILIDLAERDRDDAAARFSAASRNVTAALGRLQSMESYRADYLQRRANYAAQGVHREMLDTLQAFLDKLDLAILQLKHDVKTAQAALDSAQADLTARQRRMSALDTLHERRGAEQVRVQMRTERKLADEMAGQMALRAARPY